MGRADFIAWAVPAYKEWFRDYPGVTPSVDRINPDGHYEIGNLRLIPVGQNRRSARHFIADVAPEGTKWCPQCHAFLEHGKFYRIKNLNFNRLGLSGWCKKCTQRKNKESKAKRVIFIPPTQDVQ